MPSCHRARRRTGPRVHPEVGPGGGRGAVVQCLDHRTVGGQREATDPVHLAEPPPAPGQEPHARLVLRHGAEAGRGLQVPGPGRRPDLARHGVRLPLRAALGPGDALQVVGEQRPDTTTAVVGVDADGEPAVGRAGGGLRVVGAGSDDDVVVVPHDEEPTRRLGVVQHRELLLRRPDEFGQPVDGDLGAGRHRDPLAERRDRRRVVVHGRRYVELDDAVHGRSPPADRARCRAAGQPTGASIPAARLRYRAALRPRHHRPARRRAGSASTPTTPRSSSRRASTSGWTSSSGCSTTTSTRTSTRRSTSPT